MRIAMMGTGGFAVPTFETLLDSGHQIAALITRPVPPAVGRRKTPANPMREVALSRNVPVLDPEDVNAEASHDAIRRLAPDLLVVSDYGQILSAATLTLAPLGGINLHASLLPEYRGAAPINRAILDGKTETGVTVLHITPRLDSGPCLVQRRIEIGPDEDAVSLERRLARLGVEPVLEAIQQLARWDRQSPLGIPQDPARATRAPRLKKEEGQVHWQLPAQRIFNQVRALKPWPGTYTTWHPEHGEPVRLILDQVAVVAAQPTRAPTAAGETAAALPEAPGRVVRVDKSTIEIATGAGRLAILRLQPSGKRSMETGEFLRGHVVNPGDRWGP